MAIEVAMTVENKKMHRLLGAVGAASAVAIALAAAAVLAPAASAQEAERVLDAVDRIGTQRSGDYYHSRSLWGQVGVLTGLGGGFPERRVSRDAQATTGAIRELLILQTQNTPTLRVPDLPSPYNTSVQLLPTSQFNSRIVGSELNFEPLPRR